MITDHRSRLFALLISPLSIFGANSDVAYSPNDKLSRPVAGRGESNDVGLAGADQGLELLEPLLQRVGAGALGGELGAHRFRRYEAMAK
jgi:hypothetical protein